MLRVFLLFFMMFTVAAYGQTLPVALKTFVEKIQATEIGNAQAAIKFRQINNELMHVQVKWETAQNVKQNRVCIELFPAFDATFHWAPHLTPENEHIIAQHVFRAPALIFKNDENYLAMVPDLDLLQKGSPAPWFLDMDARQNKMELGMSQSKVTEHVLFAAAPGAWFPKGEAQLSFYLMYSQSAEDLQNPWRRPLEFMWSLWGKPLFSQGEPMKQADLLPYVEQTYTWAFQNWRKAVWQQFELEGKQVGAPVFIVNTTQSPNYHGPVNEREFRSIWNQAWFSSIRSATGLYRFARRTQNDSLRQKALLTKELALSFPQRSGFFPSVIATEMEWVEENGQLHHRSKGWETRNFGNSNRNPYTSNPRLAPYHIADMSFTASWMLDWYNELEKDERLLKYVQRYADALITIQDQDGFFPAWLSLVDLSSMPHLLQSPETSASATLLFKLYNITKKQEYLDAAVQAVKAVNQKVIPVGQWEDFETYWSCSRYGADHLVGRKVERNNMFKQNTFSIFWTAEALFNAWEATGDRGYLRQGQAVLDELLMAQALWQPPFMAIRTLGGFGVMNADGEWNDARQSLFAEMIIRYGVALNKPEYLERGIAALKASFTMMYTPLNPQTLVQWEKRWPFFGEADYGFMMENYGHEGRTDASGLGIGEFTIYDWGNGAAAEAWNRIKDRYPDLMGF